MLLRVWQSKVIIDGTQESLRFEDVEVESHNLRPDLFEEGGVTAIDVIMSLGDQEKLSYDVEWYESIGTAGVVRNYFVQRMNSDAMWGRCGFVYDSGGTTSTFLRTRGSLPHRNMSASSGFVFNTAPKLLQVFFS